MNNSLSLHPVLPTLLRLPLKYMPPAMHSRLFVSSLNYLLKQELLDNELDFLQHKVIALHVTDAPLTILFTLQNHRILACHSRHQADLTMQGTAYDFLLMLSRREDPDTLFFNRRLKLSGDTELGLYVKNFIDALDVTERWKQLHLLSDKASRIAEKFT